MFQKIHKLWSKPILTGKGSKYGKSKSIHSSSLWLLYLNAEWYLSKHWRLTIFSWASVPILDFLDQQEKAAFIHKFFLLWCLKYFSVNWLTGCSKIKAFINAKLPRPARRVHLCHIFLALPVKNGPLPAELKFRENTGYCVITLFWKIPYLPMDRPHPRTGCTLNFQWFSWEKKNSEVKYRDK